jgi:hypothetical protein
MATSSGWRMADSILKRKETRNMSDIEILNQIKDLANTLASSRDKRYVSEVVEDILSGRLDQWDREEMAKDFCEEDEG